jgi:hypothetical protein
MATEAEAKIEDGGLAFPGSRFQQVGTVADHGFSDDDTPTFDLVQHPGMTARDWFAGQALIGLLSSRESQLALYADASAEGKDTTTYVAEAVFEMADAMIAARKAGA